MPGKINNENISFLSLPSTMSPKWWIAWTALSLVMILECFLSSAEPKCWGFLMQWNTCDNDEQRLNKCHIHPLTAIHYKFNFDPNSSLPPPVNKADYWQSKKTPNNNLWNLYDIIKTCSKKWHINPATKHCSNILLSEWILQPILYFLCKMLSKLILIN